VSCVFDFCVAFQFVDIDNFLINTNTLKHLIAANKSLVAPMLTVGKSLLYANFWCGTDERGYYKRTPLYIPTLGRERKGCFPVPMIYGTVLIDLRLEASIHLSYEKLPLGYQGPDDDMLVFAASAKAAGLQMYVLNSEVYGHLLPSASQFSSMDELRTYYNNYKMTTLLNYGEIPYTDNVRYPTTPTSSLGFDKVYLINLMRQSERRKRMLSALNELGLEYTVVNAVDGRNMTTKDLNEMGIKPMPGYQDPILKRKLTMGEIGCFLSHYKLWKEVIEEADTVVPSWELIYLGRKQVYSDEDEPFVPGANQLVFPSYSYWTLAYTLTLDGAKKLLAQHPLEKLIPVDEYIPIMFDKHDNPEWMEAFSPRNLNAYSAQPLLVHPTHYIGDPGYISDTENTPVVHDEL
jgi:collagen beta-1,O-galactosyltransferase